MTDTQTPAAATATDQAAETDTRETEHLPTTDHQEIHTVTDQSQGQDPTPETETAIEGNAAEHQTARITEGHNRPTKTEQLSQG